MCDGFFLYLNAFKRREMIFQAFLCTRTNKSARVGAINHLKEKARYEPILFIIFREINDVVWNEFSTHANKEEINR